MTSSNDFDRRLGSWLEEGPNRAPERSIDAALAHAGTHPRRRDPLAALRRDPMSGGGGGVLRPLPLIAALGLILVAALGAATVGGLFDRSPSVVVPVETAQPSVSPSAAPSAGPSATPSGPAIPAPSAINVDLIAVSGDTSQIAITDGSGTLEGAISGTPADGGSVTEGTIDIVADPSDPNTLVLTWTGQPCDDLYGLLISTDRRTMTIERTACSGDSIPADHVLRLTFDGPLDPAAITGKVVTRQR